eukprot:429608_1
MTIVIAIVMTIVIAYHFLVLSYSHRNDSFDDSVDDNNQAGVDVIDSTGSANTIPMSLKNRINNIENDDEDETLDNEVARNGNEPVTDPDNEGRNNESDKSSLSGIKSKHVTDALTYELYQAKRRKNRRKNRLKGKRKTRKKKTMKKKKRKK